MTRRARDAPLRPEQILAAAEEVLRRHGPEKANVVDVARALGVSHGSVYRHFASKAALRDAVTARWLERIAAPLERIVAAPGPGRDRLRQWIAALVAAKRRLVRDDPELFATYFELAAGARAVVAAHVEAMVAQLARIVDDAVARGELPPQDGRAAARAVFDATARFHHPAHAAEWSAAGVDAALLRVVELVIAGLERGRLPGDGRRTRSPGLRNGRLTAPRGSSRRKR